MGDAYKNVLITSDDSSKKSPLTVSTNLASVESSLFAAAWSEEPSMEKCSLTIGTSGNAVVSEFILICSPAGSRPVMRPMVTPARLAAFPINPAICPPRLKDTLVCDLQHVNTVELLISWESRDLISTVAPHLKWFQRKNFEMIVHVGRDSLSDRQTCGQQCEYFAGWLRRKWWKTESLWPWTIQRLAHCQEPADRVPNFPQLSGGKER